MVADEKGKYLSIRNPQLLGYDHSEWLALEDGELIRPEDVKNIITWANENLDLFRYEWVSWEGYLRRADGEFVLVRCMTTSTQTAEGLGHNVTLMEPLDE